MFGEDKVGIEDPSHVCVYINIKAKGDHILWLDTNKFHVAMLFITSSQVGYVTCN